MTESTEAPFLEHLEELRIRLGRALGAVFILSLIAFAWAGALFDFLSVPLMEAAEEGVTLIGTAPAEAFMVKIKVALLAGAIAASPFIFYQLWCFISPGLYEHETKMVIPFVFFTTLFFLGGVSFCFFVVLPFAFQFFIAEYGSIGVNPTLRIGEYLSFLIRVLLVFGIVFEMPVVSYFLARLGILTSDWLIEQARYALVTVFVLAAILTPPDVATQVLLALPLTILYGLCIGITWMVQKKKTGA